MQRAQLFASTFAASLLVLGSAHLQAQQFNGVMQFQILDDETSKLDTMTQTTKGSKVRFDGMGKERVSMVADGKNMLLIIPSEKKYAMSPVTKDKIEDEESGSAVKTGKTESIAGFTCEDWHYKSSNSDGKKEEGDACLAKGAGLMMTSMGADVMTKFMKGGSKDFAAALLGGSGLMKVTSNGKVSLIAIKAQAINVPDSMFEPPAGYSKIGNE